MPTWAIIIIIVLLAGILWQLTRLANWTIQQREYAKNAFEQKTVEAAVAAMTEGREGEGMPAIPLTHFSEALEKMGIKVDTKLVLPVSRFAEELKKRGIG